MSTNGQGSKWRRNSAENFNRLSRVQERYEQADRRQTDGRRQQFTFAKNVRSPLTGTWYRLLPTFCSSCLSMSWLKAHVYVHTHTHTHTHSPP